MLWFYINSELNLDDWSTVHCSITPADLQLDAQNSHSLTYNTFIKILYMFRALPCSSSGGPRRNCIYAVSGIVTLCRWLPCAPVNRCTGRSPAESDDARGGIYTVVTWTSWRWAGQCTKHVEDFNKCIICQWMGILCIKLEINRD
jgi:hypothetical protein